jgi:hypothetical protein
MGGNGVGQRVSDQFGAQVIGDCEPTTRREAMSMTDRHPHTSI